MVAIGEGGVHLVHGHGVHARHLVLLLPLHPPVLEPDLDLPLRQAKRMSDLDPEDEKLNFDFPQTGSGYWLLVLVTGYWLWLPASARQISVKVELLF